MRGTIYALALPLSTLLYQFRKFTPTFLQSAARVVSGYAWGQPSLTRAALSVSLSAKSAQLRAESLADWAGRKRRGFTTRAKGKKILASVNSLALDSRFSK